MFDKPMSNNITDQGSVNQSGQQLNGFGNTGVNLKNGAPTVSTPEVDVHAMPKKFLPQGQPSGGGSFGKVALIVIGVLVVVGVAAAGVYWYMNRPKPAPQNNNQAPVVDQNTNINTNQPVVDNTNVNNNQNSNTNTDVNVNLNVNTNTNTNTNTNLPDNGNADADNDGLTYNEEFAFGTNVNNDDTDRDGYKDGAEIKNLYSPLLPSQTLVDSGLVTNFVNDMFAYSVYRPTAWLAQALGEDLGTVTILPDSESGEFFTIVTRANTNKLTLIKAREAVSDILPNNIGMVNYTLAKTPALRSGDQTKVLMVTNDFIYVISHNVGSSGQNSLATTFDMMLNSFKLLKVTKTPQTNG